MRIVFFLLLGIVFLECSNVENDHTIYTVSGPLVCNDTMSWLSHEHILVDFIGADTIDPSGWNHDLISSTMLPFLNDVKEYGVDIFVDATPQFLGRDVALLKKLSELSDIAIVTNTGLYGAVDNKYIPAYAYDRSAEELATMWIDEFENGIDGTSIRPGFIKISVDNRDTLEEMDRKIVEAAALTHLSTGLSIASHTGEATALWPQLEILVEMGVDPSKFIWVHAQNEKDPSNYLKAAAKGCWISLDGLGWDIDDHMEKILFAKTNGILNHILISHDSGWYDPQKEEQSVKPYTDIFTKLKPALMSRGFMDEEWKMLMSENSMKAFSIKMK